MKVRKILSSLLAAFLIMSAPMPAFATINDAESSKADQSNSISNKSYFAGGDSLSGIVVQSQNNLDYPFSPQTSYWSINAEAKKVVSTISRLGMDTIFYPVTPHMSAMYRSRHLPKSKYLNADPTGISLKDPLKSLVTEAGEQGLTVCAVISPFDLGSLTNIEQYPSLAQKHPEWVIKNNTSAYLNPKLPEVQQFIGSIAGELISNYKIHGVVLDFSACIDKNNATIEDLQAVVQEVGSSVHRRSASAKIGVILPGDLLQGSNSSKVSAFLQTSLQERNLNFIMPQINGTVAGENTYNKTLMQWKNLVEPLSDAKVFAYQDASRIYSPLTESVFYPDTQEIVFQQFSNKINGISGSVVSSLYNVILSPFLFDSLITDTGSFWYLDSTLQKPQNLVIGNPAETVTTDQSHYQITGTCDPGIPLYLDSQVYDGRFGEIDPSGCFSLEVPLILGSNRFSFTQGARTRTVTIVRKDNYEDNKTHPILEIVPESAYPSNSESISILSPVTLSCVAPSGAEITAMLSNGKKYQLTQQDTSIAKGYPAKYSAVMPLEESESLQVKNLGHVSYSMVYNGQLRLQSSLGELIHIGSQQNLPIRIIDPLAPVFKDSSENEIIHTLVEGTKDYVTQSSENYFYLSSGGCIRKTAAKVLTDKTDIYTISKKIKNVVIQSTTNGEYITLVGGKDLPCIVDYDPSQHTVTLRLSHVLEIPQQLNYLDSEMFESIHVSTEENTANIIMKLKENMPFLGYQISSNENNIIIDFRSTVSSKEDFDPSHPLEGINIVIDPGHGGKDVGAPSLLETQGPNEDALNLAVARALYDRLDALGANVFLTRTSHSSMAGLDRIMFAQYRDADLFLSIHHCAQESEGILVTCNNEFSRSLAEMVSNGLSKRLQRTQHEVRGSTTYVSEVTSCPAIGIHPAYLMDASDYCSASSPVDIYRSAYQISEDVRKFLIQSNQQYQNALITEEHKEQK